MSLYDEVFENNRSWARDVAGSDASFFDNLAKGQSPEFLFIGCSDSRVPPNTVMGLGPGRVFVHRNVANVVSHTDDNIQSVIEYAVKHLRVKHIVVCGHTSCGGVGAAMQAAELGSLNGYLRDIKEVYLDHHAELSALDADARYDRLIELNVQHQLLNVLKTPSVQERIAEDDAPTLHGWVFDLASGHLKDLDLDLSGEMQKITALFNLGGANA